MNEENKRHDRSKLPKEKMKQEQRPGIRLPARLLNLLVAFALLVSQSLSIFTVARAETFSVNNYLAVESRKSEYRNSVTKVDGKAYTAETVTDLHDGIFLFAYGAESIETLESITIAADSYTNEGVVYSKGKMGIYCGTVSLANILIAEGDLEINCSDLSSLGYTVLYSVNGNITLSVGEADYEGLIYAPNGTVTVNASVCSICGAVVCDTLVTNTAEFKCVGTEKTDTLYELMSVIRNDTVVTAEYTVDEENRILIEYESNKALETVEVYVRYDEGEFQYYGTLPEDGLLIPSEEHERVDVGIIGVSVLGETARALAESFEWEDGILAYYFRDADIDGILDIDEVWYTMTDPQCADTDGDGFDDYEECFLLFTDPNVATDDLDIDGDGLLNSEELAIGTDPVERDSDFDGISDGEDESPTIYDFTENQLTDYTVKVGSYDKVCMTVSSDGTVTESVYDYVNDVIKASSVDELLYTFHYNADGRITAEIIKVQDDYRVNIYSYDEDGNLVRVYNHADLYSFDYTEEGELYRVQINGEDILSYSEDATEAHFGNGDTMSVTEDENGYQIAWNGDASAICTFSGDGLTQAIYDLESGVVYTYEYDEDGYLTSISSSAGYAISYTYEDESMRVDYSDGTDSYAQTIDYSEDSISALVEMLSGAVLTEKYEDDDTKVYRVTLGESVIQETVYEYDDDNQLTRMTCVDGTTYEYFYNGSGQITQVEKDGEVSVTYEYDTKGQLVRESNVLAGYTSEYSYDLYNNLMGVTVAYQDGDTESHVYSYDSEAWNDVLTAYDGSKITYDEIGNPVLYYDGSKIDWNGRLLAGFERDGVQVSYSYDVDGIRTYKNVNGVETFYLIEGGDIIAEKTDGETIWYLYNEYDDMCGFLYGGESYYYDKNGTGDVVRILDGEGNVCCTYSYDAWGNVTEITGDETLAETNPIRYRSYYYDEESGFYYLESRYYDSSLKRFLNADDLTAFGTAGMDINLFAYAGCDPVNLYDPTGEATIRVSFFALNEFEDAIKALEYGIRDKLVTSDSVTYTRTISDDKDNFKKWWATLDGEYMAVLLVHGSPKTIGGKKDSEVFLRASGVSNLPEISITWFVLLGCNCGHNNYSDNIARAFANRVSGRVIASDGTVTFTWTSSDITFTSVNDGTFDDLTKKVVTDFTRNNYGWMVFHGTGLYYNAKISFLFNGSKTLTVTNFCRLIKDTTLYLNYK